MVRVTSSGNSLCAGKLFPGDDPGNSFPLFQNHHLIIAIVPALIVCLKCQGVIRKQEKSGTQGAERRFTSLLNRVYFNAYFLRSLSGGARQMEGISDAEWPVPLFPVARPFVEKRPSDFVAPVAA